VFELIRVIGKGRVGNPLSLRLQERGIRCTDGDEADLVILCVQDARIAAVAAGVSPGPWIAHVSGATPLDALQPHTRRFSVHPLQTFRRGGGAEQFDGAWGAVSYESDAARVRGWWLAEVLGLRPVSLDESNRLAYHAGAVIASNYMVTLFRAAAWLLARAGIPPEAAVPLMKGTIGNGFELTGPIARGDWQVVTQHLAELERLSPEIAAMYSAMAKATAESIRWQGQGESNDIASSAADRSNGK